MPTLSIHNEGILGCSGPTQKKVLNDISPPTMILGSLGPTQKKVLNDISPPTKIRRHSEVTSSTSQQQGRHEQRKQQPSFGICFDVDGVIAHGTLAIPGAAKAFKRLTDDQGQFKIPVAFVTNSLNQRSARAEQLSRMLGVPVANEQVIQAPGPLEIFTKLHDKFCLIVGQGKVLDIAAELGFRNMCTIEDVVKAYPLLDVVDHDNRRKNETIDGRCDSDFKRVEAIILMGEPKRWESVLQILVDLLRSDGKLSQLGHTSSSRSHLPIIACNMDLEFKDRAPTARFGHGAFLVCLEALYQKLTGNELQYTALVGKPSEITFRFAEHVLTQQRNKLGLSEDVKTMYLIGDAPATDIAGSNLYHQYVERLCERRTVSGPVAPDSQDDLRIELIDPALPDSRNVPRNAKFDRQTVTSVVPVLVCTGIYKPDKENSIVCVEGTDTEDHGFYHGHRDFPKNDELQKPEFTCNDVSDAVDAILAREGWAVV